MTQLCVVHPQPFPAAVTVSNHHTETTPKGAQPTVLRYCPAAGFDLLYSVVWCDPRNGAVVAVVVVVDVVVVVASSVWAFY